MANSKSLRPYLVSWIVDDPDFEYHGPWWISGYDSEDRNIVCAAVMARSEAEARRIIYAAHDHPPRTLAWRFVEAQEEDWSPFNTRFQRAKWMKWPWPEVSRG